MVKKSFGTRDYKRKAAAPAAKAAYTRKAAPAAQEEAPERTEREERPARPAYQKRESGGYSGGGGGYKKGGYQKGGQQRGDAEFVHVTGLFGPTKKGAYTVFIKEEMLEKFNDLQPDDLLGISESQHGWSLWIKKADK
jgi:hypothetical protein